MSTAYAAAMIQDAPDGPGVLTPDDDGKFMMWDGSRKQMIMAAIRMTGQANTILRSGGYRIQDSSDGPGVLTAGDDGKALTWDNGTGRFVMTAFEASGAVAAHVALADPHTQYELESANTAAAILTKILTVDGAGSGLDADLLDGNSSAAFLLATGATTGASSQAQTFTNGIVSATVRGGTAANDDITIEGTSHATKTSSYVTLQPSGGYVGIGTSTPATAFHLYSTAANTEMRFQNIVDTGSPVLTFYRARGTVGAETPIVNGGRVGEIQFRGWGATDYYPGGFLRMIGNATWSDTSAPTDFHVMLSPSASVTPVEVLTCKSSGNVGIGTTVPTAVLHVKASTTARASLCVPHGAAPTSPVDGDIWTTTAGLYVRINGVTVGPLS